MQQLGERVIEVSKTKIWIAVVGALVFVWLGYWLLQLDAAEIEQNRRLDSPVLVHGLGVVTMVFFGLCGVVGLCKLFSTKPGLVLNRDGLLLGAGGLVPWSEIEGFAVFAVNRQRSLVVLLSDPQKYVESGGAIKRVFNRMNYKLVGSPIALASNALAISFDELHALCIAYHQQYLEHAR